MSYQHLLKAVQLIDYVIIFYHYCSKQFAGVGNGVIHTWEVSV